MSNSLSRRRARRRCPRPRGRCPGLRAEGGAEELFRVVRSAVAGGLGLAPEVVGDLVGQVLSPDPELTARELDVVRLLARGRSNRAIADTLFLSEATVKTHLVRIYRKLGAANRAAAVSEAVRRGLLELG